MSALVVKMTRSEADAVTRSIRTTLTRIGQDVERVVRLIEQAKTGEAHLVLGYANWAAYVVSEFTDALSLLDRADRQQVVAELSATGMSVRAIAAVTAVSKSTVADDLSQVSGNWTPAGRPAEKITTTSTTTGTDGKTYVRNGRATAAGVDAIGDAVPPVRPPSRRKPLADAYWAAMFDLEKAVARVERLQADDRFPRLVSTEPRHRSDLFLLAGRVATLAEEFAVELAVADADA